MNLNDIQAAIHSWADKLGWKSKTINDPNIYKTDENLARIAKLYSKYSKVTNEVEQIRTTTFNNRWVDEEPCSTDAIETRAYVSSQLCGKNVIELVGKLVLIHTEVDEAIEEALSGRIKTWANVNRLNTNGLPKPEGMISELQDIIIRCLHILAELEADTELELAMKQVYNEGREYRHGKKA